MRLRIASPTSEGLESMLAVRMLIEACLVQNLVHLTLYQDRRTGYLKLMAQTLAALSMLASTWLVEMCLALT